jgi:trimeric autotransporter adhesin
MPDPTILRDPTNPVPRAPRARRRECFPFATSLAARVSALVLMLATAPLLEAQCQNVWRPGSGVAGVLGWVYASTMWDPDGSGPATAVLAVAGSFSVAGNQAVRSIATYDPVNAAWSRVGSGQGPQGGYSTLYALAAMPNGDLVVGGSFSSFDGVPAESVARWNGSTWSPVGAGLTWSQAGVPHVQALCVRMNGNLVAAGRFTNAGSVAASGIAEWDGTSWSPLGNGFDFLAPPRALATLPNGDLIAGGDFSVAGGIAVGGVARWDGTSWMRLGAAQYGQCKALAVTPNGDLIVIGSVANIVGSVVARWNGAAWQAIGNLGFVSGDVLSLAALPNGDILVGGQFYGARFVPSGSMPANSLLRWNGLTWSQLGNGLGTNEGSVASSAIVNTMTSLPSGLLVVAGDFHAASGLPTTSIAAWDGAAWGPLAPFAGVDRAVAAMAVMQNGDLVVGGHFRTAGFTLAGAVARWDGQSWSALGAGLGSGETFRVEAMTTLSNGDLVVGGYFYGGPGRYSIARWDGTAWNPLGIGPNYTVKAFAMLPGGQLIAGGDFWTAGGQPAQHIAAWNGASWSGLGAGLDADVTDLVVMPNGNLIAAGRFTTAGSVAANRIAQWDGTSWSTLGTGLDGPAFALALRPNGDLVVGGYFGSAGGVPAANIALWNGSSWSPLGSGTNGWVETLMNLPNGDLAVGGDFTFAGSLQANRIARWNGNSW